LGDCGGDDGVVESRAMRSALSLVILCTLTTTAWADNKQVAKQAYVDGKRHYDVGEFSEALADFKKAYLNYAEPVFLFNIAQCHRQLGDKPAAVRSYRTFLREFPEAPNRATVERIIAELEAPAIETPRPPPTVTAPPRQPVATSSTPPRPTTPPPPEPKTTAPSTATATPPKSPTVTPAPPRPSEPVRKLSRFDVTEMEEVAPNFDRPSGSAPTPPSRVYKKWWFWTVITLLIGGVVAVTVGVPLSQSASSSFSPTLPTWSPPTARGLPPIPGLTVRW
jgi:hypothetical protein